MSKVVIISTVNLKHMTGAAYYFNCLSKKKKIMISFALIKYKDEERAHLLDVIISISTIWTFLNLQRNTKLIKFLLYRNCYIIL